MKIKVLTDHPVALHSPDHQQAAHSGSGNDNSTNPHFIAKLRQWNNYGPLSVLDIGCAGGGFVKSLLDDGYFAVGLEGSDYSLLKKRAEWATIPDNLFTCDVSKSFAIVSDDDSQQTNTLAFDIVTAWEVMEHFSDAELPQVISNVVAHLKPDGVWVMSVSTDPDGNNFHRCVHNRAWWLATFAAHGLKHDEDVWAAFEPDWVRGPKPTPWAIVAPGSFHLCLRRQS